MVRLEIRKVPQEIVEAILEVAQNVRVYQEQNIIIRQELEIYQLSYVTRLQCYA